MTMYADIWLNGVCTVYVLMFLGYMCDFAVCIPLAVVNSLTTVTYRNMGHLIRSGQTPPVSCKL